MAQLLDPDAIFATAEPTRRSGRAPQPRQNFAQDAYRAEREEEKKRKAALAKKPRGPSRPAPPRSKWENYERRVDGQISKARSAAFFIETYAMDANRGSKRVQPKQELAKAKATLKAARSEIRSVLEEVAGLHSEIRWGTEKELTEEDRNADLVPDEAKIREEDQNLPGINVEEVACSICGQYESTDDNDIIMCDRTNCFRAFHVNCADPPLTPEDLGGPDDDWFCHQCNCLYNCIEHINEEFEADYTETGWARVFAEEESDDEGDGGGGDAPGNSILTMDLGSGSDDDSDFGDAPAAGGGGDSVDGSDAGGGGDSVDDSDSDSESGCSSAVSDCSGDDPARYGGPPKRDREAVTTENIVEGPRKRTKVDYNVLNATFSDSEESDGGAYAGGK